MTSAQPILFHAPAIRRARPAVAVTPEVRALLDAGAACAMQSSGGKDGSAAAIATMDYLDAIGHSGPRVLMHADLGEVEWEDSLPMCEELAALLGLELVVVRHGGGLLERWRGRWRGNVARYAALSTVTLVLPWSTPKLRFCTSEKKEKPLASALKRRYPGRPLLSVTGIRRQESAARSKKPVAAPSRLLTRTGLPGMLWHPVIDFLVEDVWATNDGAGLRRHVAYARHGLTRCSCKYCIMSSAHDLRASVACEGNHALYVALVELEAESGFGFQQRWLADLAPHLLSPALRARVAEARRRALERERLEAQIPDRLRFIDGVPLTMPTAAEAALLARVRRGVAAAAGIRIGYDTGDAVMERYAELLAAAAVKCRRKRSAGGASRAAAAAPGLAAAQLPLF